MTHCQDTFWRAFHEDTPTSDTRGTYSVEGEPQACTRLRFYSTDGRLWTTVRNKSAQQLLFPAELCQGELTILEYQERIGFEGWNTVAGLSAYYPFYPGQVYVLQKR